VPAGTEPPKRGDFISWSALVVNHAVPSRQQRVRSYLKSVAQSAWELANWLTHAANATPFDGQLALDATASVLGAFAMMIVRAERGAPERCPDCGSYRLAQDYRSDVGGEGTYFLLCATCGWERPE